MSTGLFGAVLDRRRMLALTAGAVPVYVGTTLGVPDAMGGGLPSASGVAPRGFDPLSAQDNLDAYIRLVHSMDASDVNLSWFGGRVFSVIGDREVIKPLFDVEGFGIGRTLPQPDGSYRTLWREVGYYKDLASGKIMERWANPMLGGEVVETYPINNDPVNAHMKRELRLGFGATKDEVSQVIPFVMPWHFQGSNAMAGFDVNLAWKTPLDPKVWKRESPGEMARVSEYQQWRVDANELADRSVPSLRPYGSWNRIGAWLPWMLMGQQPGHLFYRSHTLKPRRVEDLPRHLVDYTEKRFPKYLTPPNKWTEPNVSSFEMYERDRKPAQ